MGLQIGVEPIRIDILTKVSGPTFGEAWPGRLEADLAPGVRCAVIGLEDLIRNKRAAGRPQDLADADVLERLRKRSTPG